MIFIDPHKNMEFIELEEKMRKNSNRDRDPLSMQEVDISNGEFYGENYAYHNLQMSDLSLSTFTECNFDSVDFSGCNLECSTFSKCNLNGADFTSCDLTNAIFDDCDLPDAQFIETERLDATIFSNCRLQRANFTGSVLHNITFNDCKMENADFSWAVLNCCSLQQDEQSAFMKVNAYIIYDQLLAALLPAMKHGNVKCNYIDKLLESNTIRKVFEKLVEDGKLDKEVERFITQYYNKHDLMMF